MNNNIELIVQQLLLFMKDKVEESGKLIQDYNFSLYDSFKTPSKINLPAGIIMFHYAAHEESRIIPVGKDFDDFTLKYNLESTILSKAINTCITREYIRESLNSIVPEPSIYLTPKGYDTALKLSENDFNNSEKIQDINSRYHEEKSKGGKNSYQRYKPLRDKVKELCQIELSKNKSLSARQLSHVIAKIIEDKHSTLLDSFIPYTQFQKDNTDWRLGTFYDWCNTIFKQHK